MVRNGVFLSKKGRRSILERGCRQLGKARRVGLNRMERDQLPKVLITESLEEKRIKKILILRVWLKLQKKALDLEI